MTNSRMGDLFDVIYEDAPKEAFARYACLIDATKEGSFKKANPDLNVLASDDIDLLEKQLNKLAADLMPCTVDGLHWLVSEDENGAKYLSIFNNEGNHRTFTKGDTIDHARDRWVTIKGKAFSDPEIVYQTEGCELQKNDETFKAFVPATGFVVIKF